MNQSPPDGMQCPICQGASSLALMKEGYPYFECAQCAFLYHRKDAKSPPESTLEFYDSRYWEMEQAEARRREQEDCFLRALELLYLSTIKVENVLDFGCGLGITVQLLRERLALNAVGVDLSAGFEETAYLHRCELEELLGKYPLHYFDAIYSIEVFEHLEDPVRILKLLGALLAPGGKILINTATREYMLRHDPEQTYIDPVRRGHISIYSLESLKKLAASIDCSAEFLGDRKYATILSPAGAGNRFPNPENLEKTRNMGEWYPLLLGEYMRLVFLEKEFDEKCVWINQLLKEKAPIWSWIRRRLRK